MSSARGRKRKSYHHGDLRRALLDATLALAAEHGAAGVGLREAARAAGVSQTAPYRHFADKTAMLAAAAEEGFVLFDGAMQRALAEIGDDARAQVIAIGETYVRFALDRTAHFRLMFGQGSPPKAATPALQAAARRAFQTFLGTLERALAKTADARAAKAMMFRLWALAHGIAMLALERQLLFDTELDKLLASTRESIAAMLPTRRVTR